MSKNDEGDFVYAGFHTVDVVSSLPATTSLDFRDFIPSLTSSPAKKRRLALELDSTSYIVDEDHQDHGGHHGQEQNFQKEKCDSKTKSMIVDYWGEDSSTQDGQNSRVITDTGLHEKCDSKSMIIDYWGEDSSTQDGENSRKDKSLIVDNWGEPSTIDGENGENSDKDPIYWDTFNQDSALRFMQLEQAVEADNEHVEEGSDANPVLYMDASSQEVLQLEQSGKADSHTDEEEGSDANPVLYMDASSQEVLQLEQSGKADSHTDEEEDDMAVLFTLNSKCCSQQCFRDLTVNDVVNCRNTKTDKQWVLKNLSIFRKGGKSCFVIAGKTVCSTCWKQAYRLSDKIFNDACTMQDNKVVEVIHGNKGSQRNSPKADNTCAWFDIFIGQFGEYMPHVDLTLIPSALTKRLIHSKMLLEHDEQHLAKEVVGERQFYKIWIKDYPKVKIRKESNFTKCTICTVSADERGKTLDKEKRKKIYDVMSKHLESARKEREAYEKHKAKSRSDDKYLCIAVDGMDQSKTSLPHLTRQDKSSHGWRLRTHLTGALVHSTADYGKDFMVFVNTADIPSDSNLTLNVLVLTLEAHVKKYNKLPEVLYLQFDNCWRENKNMYVLGFAYLLVALKIVKKVKINFLIVGHTHNDVDQAFSRLAEALRKIAAYTLDRLKEVIEKSYEKPPPTVVVLNHLYDFKSWLQHHFAGVFKHHTGPHNFRIKVINGETVLHYRHHTGDKWEPSEGLKTFPELSEVPPWVTPILERLGVDMLRKDIPKIYHRMDTEEKQWWESYLENLEETRKPPPQRVHWPLMSIAATASTTQVSDSDCENGNLPTTLESIWNKVTQPRQPVTIGAQGKPSKSRASNPSGQGDEQLPEDHGEICDNTGIETEEHNNTAGTGTEHDGDVGNDISQYAAIQKKDMVGVFVHHHWDGSPQIGEVLNVDFENETIELHWFHASWTGKCTPLWVGSAANRKPKSELIDIRCAVLWQFKLTQSKYLKSVTVKRLKAAYRDIPECRGMDLELVS